MQAIQQFFQSGDVPARFILSIGVLIVFYLARRGTARWLIARIDDPDRQYQGRKLIGYVTAAFTVLALAWIWFPIFGSIATFLGILSAGLAVALQDLFINVAGWVYILSQQPFVVGDRIEIASHAGDVVDITGLRFTLREIGNWVDADQPTGRLVHIPNGFVFSHTMANYTRDISFVWHEVHVLVTFESDWHRAEQRVIEALRPHVVPEPTVKAAEERAANRLDFPIEYGATTIATYVTTAESGVVITGRVLVEARRRRKTEDGFWRAFLDAIADDPTVNLAYPTVRTVLQEPVAVVDADTPPSDG